MFGESKQRLDINQGYLGFPPKTLRGPKNLASPQLIVPFREVLSHNDYCTNVLGDMGRFKPDLDSRFERLWSFRRSQFRNLGQRAFSGHNHS